MDHVPTYVVERVRKPVPKNCWVIPSSTPVVWFGNVPTARVATLGLNPSRAEFTATSGAAKGAWLSGENRRLATYESLGVDTLTGTPDDVVAQVVAECNDYFHRNPYWGWFKQLEALLSKSVGVSYLDGSACHLDLVQWATDPVWAKLPSTVRKALIADDREFLRRQLMQEQIRLVLMNGRGVIQQVKAMGVELDEVAPAVAGPKTAAMVVGREHGTLFVGWSVNLQSGFGVTNALKEAITDRVHDEAPQRELDLHATCPH